jgi:hypothetical protein
MDIEGNEVDQATIRLVSNTVAGLHSTLKRAERLQMEVQLGLGAATQALMVSRELLSRLDEITNLDWCEFS